MIFKIHCEGFYFNRSFYFNQHSFSLKFWMVSQVSQNLVYFGLSYEWVSSFFDSQFLIFLANFEIFSIFQNKEKLFLRYKFEGIISIVTWFVFVGLVKWPCMTPMGMGRGSKFPKFAHVVYGCHLTGKSGDLSWKMLTHFVWNDKQNNKHLTCWTC